MKWQYINEYVKGTRETNTLLNALGQDSWELVSVVQGTRFGDGQILYLKRPYDADEPKAASDGGQRETDRQVRPS